MVIYSSGLWPYLFLISLMLGSGFPPVLPWPTGRRAWVGPLRNCLEPTPQTHWFPHFSASLPCSPPFFLTCSHFMYTVSQSLSNSRTHKRHLFIHSHCLCPFVSLLLSRSRLPSVTSFEHSVACKRPRTLREMIAHAHICSLHFSPSSVRCRCHIG